MTKKVKQVVPEAESYAAVHEFCTHFVMQLKSFYQLAFLLTGSSEGAQQAILGALDDCKSARVFKPWIGSWTRLAVIERALKVETDFATKNFDEEGTAEQRAILRLGRFERFVFTLSVLEKYSVRDCAILLRMSKREISEARTRAIQAVSAALPVPFGTQENAIALGA